MQETPYSLQAPSSSIHTHISVKCQNPLTCTLISRTDKPNITQHYIKRRQYSPHPATLCLHLFILNIPFQQWQSICRAAQNLNWSALQCSQKTNKTNKEHKINKTKHSEWLPVNQFSKIYWMGFMCSEPRRMDASCNCNAECLWNCSIMCNKPESWPFCKVLIYCTSMAWQCIMC